MTVDMMSITHNHRGQGQDRDPEIERERNVDVKDKTRDDQIVRAASIMNHDHIFIFHKRCNNVLFTINCSSAIK